MRSHQLHWQVSKLELNSVKATQSPKWLKMKNLQNEKQLLISSPYSSMVEVIITKVEFDNMTILN